MSSSLNFDLHLGPGGRAGTSAQRAHGAQPARLLLLGDFSGRGAAPASAPTGGPAAQRWPAAARQVDVDSLDAVMRLMAPRLPLQLHGRAFVFAPQSLDDFHPDQLLHSLLPLQQGWARLKSLQDPAQFARAAAEWDAVQSGTLMAPPAGAGAAARGAAGAGAGAAAGVATAPASSAGELLSSLLGGRVLPAASAPALPATPAPRTGIEALLHSAVAGHVVPAAPAHQASYVAAAQAALADDLRAVLHDPAFQALEGAWRGVQLLVSRLELGENLELHLLDTGLPDLLADLVAAQGRVEATALARLFTGPPNRHSHHRDVDAGDQAQHSPHWRAAFGLFGFGAATVDLGLLAALGTAAARAQTPFVAMATAHLVQSALAADTPPAADPTGWTTLRQSPVAPWLGLVSSPLLLRLPYGQRQDPLQDLDFEEITGAVDPTPLLWGSGALAAATLLGQDCAETDAGNGTTVDTGNRTLDDLPAWVLRGADGETQLQPCAGQYLSDAEAESLQGAGLMSLLSHQRTSAVTLHRWHSIAKPLRGLSS
jgi:type VI secretion system protein ImpC